MLFEIIFQNINPAEMLMTHITGVIAHGQSKLFTFLDLNQFKHDSNLTISILLKVLSEIAEEKVIKDTVTYKECFLIRCYM